MGRFESGSPGGPGRKPNGVAAALRRLVEPDRIAEYVYGVLLDPSAPAKDRQWAAEFITDRIEGRPVQAIAAHVLSEQSGPTLPANWDALTTDERERWLDDNLPLTLPVRR